ncbi:ferredoxin-nitrite reductase [Tritonibacter multivorans]|uniref:Ferredoxin-nitrite reductase n=1 Tax=Tritonibacter multivorans TaxID=928856 RepID=A0A0P1G0X8_9RHOB|nr:precorrin-3B synthase [Tritonibacter multivorans]MDA7419375.1 precorrin-3B synthase [Tritonibacter multivorans]CUH75336.1 ferredoxin-nitrite reductase [Tritonibacter multivorans]SFD20963.1 precorrin-3B synthase [Tritonibacter multivorans]
MSEAPKVYGWCPGALRPMMSGDGLVVRIRAPLGRLSPDQARGVAALSTRLGNGVLDLSARGNLQMRGVREDDHAALIAALQALGLVDTDAGAEARRNVLLTPFWTEGDLSHRIAQQLSDALTAASDLTLPGKFGFTVDCGAAPVLSDAAADIRIERNPVQDGPGLLLLADGADMGLVVSEDSVVAEALSLARWFLAHGGAPEGRGRMHRLIARRGAPASHSANRAISASQPAPGQTASGQLVALEFGQIPAQTLAALADLGALRLTPWRMLLLESQALLPALPGLILDAADPRLRVRACTGMPGCLQAHAQTRPLARRLAAQVPPGKTLHVAGCAKGCAHPTATDLTLVACATGDFDLIRLGKASDPPLETSLSADDICLTPEHFDKGQP